MCLRSHYYPAHILVGYSVPLAVIVHVVIVLDAMRYAVLEDPLISQRIPRASLIYRHAHDITPVSRSCRLQDSRAEWS